MIRCSEIKVRGYHLDFYGHVNNARYLEFMEEARWALFEEQIDITGLQQRGIVFVVVNVNINYRKPASLGDILELSIGISRIGGTSATLRQEIKLKGTDTMVADADVTFVLADAATGKAMKMESEFQKVLKQLN